MKLSFLTFAALLSSSVATFGQTTLPDTGFFIRYAANIPYGDSVVNLTNSGASSTTAGLDVDPFQQNGQICANIYAYSPDEQLVSCCSCNVTPNGLNSLSAKSDLIFNTLTPIVPSALVIKILATKGGADCKATSAATVRYDDTVNPVVSDLVKGLVAWGTTIHLKPGGDAALPSSYAVTETEFNMNNPVKAEVDRMRSLCAFIRANGSGYGICKACRLGGLGGAAK